MDYLKNTDVEIYEIIKKEKEREENNLELIASENFVSRSVLEAQGSILTNKYAEGYPGARYYGGCKYVDQIEDLAIERAKQLFNVKYANVQPHSGSQANMGVLRALLNYKDVVLGLALDQGGHLTHGHKLSFSGIDYTFYSYHVNKKTETIDYEELEKLALDVKPKLIIAGASAYSRIIDFKRIKEIALKVNAYLMVDMAHIAGLVAVDLHPNPCEYADVVTSTTHKTLRGPRGGLILTNNEDIIKKVNKTVFPGIQGGPLMHVIAAKAVCFKEALDPSFKEYQKQVIKNAQAMANEFIKLGYHVVSSGTDNHMFLLDIKSKTGLTGKEGEKLLDLVNITCNKNTIPYDEEKPFITSGLRFGSPALTTRGFKEEDMANIAIMIDKVLMNKDDEEIIKEIKNEVKKLTEKYPLNYN